MIHLKCYLLKLIKDTGLITAITRDWDRQLLKADLRLASSGVVIVERTGPAVVLLFQSKFNALSTAARLTSATTNTRQKMSNDNPHTTTGRVNPELKKYH